MKYTDKDYDAIRELNEKRTQGDWYWSARTLRSEVMDEDGEFARNEDILRSDKDGCTYGEYDDTQFIASAPDMAAMIQQLRGELDIAIDFIEELTSLGGKYPDASGTNIVPDAYKAIRKIKGTDNE